MAGYIVATRFGFTGKVASVVEILSGLPQVPVSQVRGPDMALVSISSDDVHELRSRIGSSYLVEPESHFRAAA